MGEDAYDAEPGGDWQSRFGRARCAARRLCPGLVRDNPYDRTFHLPAETLERYRQLFVAMGLARRSPGGDAIAALARRGYVIVVQPAVLRRRGTSRVVAIDRPGIVWFGAGLPTRHQPWKAAEQSVLALDVTTYPLLRFVSAHESLRIRQQLRREGHDVG